MSIFIKGMKMPENCGDCRFCAGLADTEWGICAGCLIDDECREASSKSGCPLVEVPTPHGRLIDEENVKNAIYERLKVLQTHEVFRRKRGDIDLLGVMPYIAGIPTIIEVEGEENV